MSTKDAATNEFRHILVTVVGQAFTAAGYHLEDKPRQEAGGLFRFRKRLENGLYGFIEFQLLYLPSTEWSGNVKSRFRVSLVRSDLPDATAGDTHFMRRTLSALVVEDFGVAILPSPDYWWQFSNIDELGKGLAEAGHLVVGYGVPFLSGDLDPSSA